MNESRNKIWLLGPPLMLALLVAALYVKRPEARDFIDGKCPWVKATIGKYAPPFEMQNPDEPQETPPPVRGETGSAPPAEMPRVVPPAAPIEPEPVTPVPVANNTFDLQKVCSDPTLWPKKVRLKTEVEFPAVIEGKVVGKVRVPAGTEAHVVKLTSGKVGVEYRGGGAWIDFGHTDFIERAQTAWH